MTARHVPRLVVDLPPGWESVESAELFGPDGIILKVTAQPVGPELDAAGLAARHGEMLAEAVDGFHDEGVENGAWFGGHPALRRRTRFTSDTGAGRGLAAYLVADGVAYLASATGPADEFAASEAEVVDVIEHLTIVGRPLVTVGPDGAPSGRREARHPADAASRSTPGPSEWHEVRRSWKEARDGARPPEDTSAVLLSTDELLVIASVLGCGTFPTVDPLLLGDLPRPARDAISVAVTRSLVLRGVLVADGDAVRLADALRDLFDAALFPDLYLEVITSADGETSGAALCARPDSALLVERAGAGGRRLTWARSEDLVELAIDHGRLRPAIDGTGSPRAVALDEISRSTILRANWKEGAAVVGSEMLVAVGETGSLGLVDAAPPLGATTVSVRPATLEQVRIELLDHLPGSKTRADRGSGVLR